MCRGRDTCVPLIEHYGGYSQVVKAPGCDSGIRRFDPDYPPQVSIQSAYEVTRPLLIGKILCPCGQIGKVTSLKRRSSLGSRPSGGTKHAGYNRMALLESIICTRVILTYWTHVRIVNPAPFTLLGIRQVWSKAPDFDSGIRGFESLIPCQ